MTLAELKAARMDKGLALRAAAEEIGVSYETLRLVELGARPSAQTGHKIASFYKVKFTDIWPIADAVADTARDAA